MKAQIIAVERYRIVIDGVDIGEFEKESTWEGLVKLKDKEGRIVIGAQQSFLDGLLGGIFVDQNEPKEFTIVKISPGLLPCADDKK